VSENYFSRGAEQRARLYSSLKSNQNYRSKA
jgi:hypothetical protein